MAFSLGKTSKRKLTQVHPRLVKVVRLAIKLTPVDFCVAEGLRTEKRQRQLYNAGASQTMHSKHLMQKTGYAHAVDLGALVGGKYRGDWPLYHTINRAMRKAAKKLNTEIIWGGDWKAFPDGPHYQLAK